MEHCVGIDTVKKDGDVSRCRVRVQQTIGPGHDADVTRACARGRSFTTNPSQTRGRCALACGGPNKWGEYPPRAKAEYVGPEWEGDAWDGFAGDGEASSCFRAGCGASERERLGRRHAQRGMAGAGQEAAAYLPPVRDVDTHLVSVRVYDGEGKLAETRFIKRTRKPAA